MEGESFEKLVLAAAAVLSKVSWAYLESISSHTGCIHVCFLRAIHQPLAVLGNEAMVKDAQPSPIRF